MIDHRRQAPPTSPHLVCRSALALHRQQPGAERQRPHPTQPSVTGCILGSDAAQEAAALATATRIACEVYRTVTTAAQIVISWQSVPYTVQLYDTVRSAVLLRELYTLCTD